MQLNLVVANLQSGIGTTKNYIQYFTTAWKYLLPNNHDYVEKAAHMLEKENVDIALLTEVNEISFRSNNQSHIGTLKRVFSPANCVFFPTIKTGRYVHEGNVIISAHTITEDTSIGLPYLLIPRVLGKSLVEVDGTKITVLVAHLSISRHFRRIQIEIIANLVKSIDGPIILGGDFNEDNPTTLEPLIASGLSLHTQHNFPSWKPNRSLDYVFLSNHFYQTTCSIPDGKAFSDHSPLLIKTILRSS